MVMVLVLGAFGVGALVGVLGYTWTVGGSGEPSQTVTAPTLSLDTTQSSDSGDTTIAQLAAEVSLLGTQVKQLSDSIGTDDAAVATKLAEISAALNTLNQLVQTTPSIFVSTAQPTDSASSNPVEASATPASSDPQPTATTAVAESVANRKLFRIVAEESEVRFNIYEDLFNQPNPVIGATNQVAGDIIIDFGAPANSQVGTIVVNARTLVTNNEFRNRALRSQILQSSQEAYEFIEFTPTALSGLPESVAVGDTLTFQITGDLKIRNITTSVTFDATATLVAENRLEGTASTVVTRAAYDLQIPNAPGVANVGEEVTLEIDFVATEVQQ
jgi:polyisoprenoid-binding protein YceI